MDELGELERHLTPGEVRFLELLRTERPWLDVWLHQDDDGAPWLCVSHDFSRTRWFSRKSWILRTLRLDFDGELIEGGWSPAALNWDHGVRARSAGIDFASPDGITLRGDVEELAVAAGHWFDAHRARFSR